jgi:hypothetical protein
MSTITSSGPRLELPPADEELQDLYNQVLAGFADETFPGHPTPHAQSFAASNTERDLDSLVSAYSYSDDTPQSPDSQLGRTPSASQCTFGIIFRYSSSIDYP